MKVTFIKKLLILFVFIAIVVVIFVVTYPINNKTANEAEEVVRVALAANYNTQTSGYLAFHRNKSKFSEQDAVVAVTENVKEEHVVSVGIINSEKVLEHLFILKKYADKWTIVEDHLSNSKEYWAKMQARGLCVTYQECVEYLQNLTK